MIRHILILHIIFLILITFKQNTQPNPNTYKKREENTNPTFLPVGRQYEILQCITNQIHKQPGRQYEDFQNIKNTNLQEFIRFHYPWEGII